MNRESLAGFHSLGDILAKERPVEVSFGSDEYFSLLKKSPDVAAWMSLERNVLFALEGRLYKVTE